VIFVSAFMVGLLDHVSLPVPAALAQVRGCPMLEAISRRVPYYSTPNLVLAG
jgi:hypothetical protein